MLHCLGHMALPALKGLRAGALKLLIKKRRKFPIIFHKAVAPGIRIEPLVMKFTNNASNTCREFELFSSLHCKPSTVISPLQSLCTIQALSCITCHDGWLFARRLCHYLQEFYSRSPPVPTAVFMNFSFIDELNFDANEHFFFTYAKNATVTKKLSSRVVLRTATIIVMVSFS